MKGNNMSKDNVSPGISQEMMAEMMGKALAEGIAKGMAMAEMQRNESTRGRMPKPRDESICPKCRLRTFVCGGPEMVEEKDKDGKVVLNSDGKPSMVPVKGEDKNHMLYVCLPNDEDAALAFQGVMMGGVTFLSNHAGHRIFIPRNSDIPSMISNFEVTDREMRRGKRGSRSQVLSRQQLAQYQSQGMAGNLYR